MKLTWIKCTSGKWCEFMTVNLTHEHFNNLIGVYMVWSGEIVIRLGSGVIKDRIAAHRENSEITKYDNLKVTWAEVDEDDMQGVEKYLADTFNPAVGDRFPDLDPIVVNSPWD